MAEFAASTCLTLREIENELCEVTGEDWYPLGVQLGLRPATLREIQRNYSLDTERCRREMLDIWLHNAPQVSWKILAQGVQALNRYESLAQKLRRKIPPAPKSELSSTTSGVHGRGASTESSHSVEEQRTPPMKRKCTHNEDIMTQGFALTSGMLRTSGYQIPPSHPLYSGYRRIIPFEVKQAGDSEEETDRIVQQEKELLKTLRESIAENNQDSFHHHLDELERVVQNNQRMKVLLEQDGTLCLAAWIGSNPVVETLIQKGVDINALSTVPEHTHYFWKMSPLHWAADGGHVNTVKCLIEKGAEVNSKDDVGDFVSKAVRQDPEQTTEECTITDFPNTNVLLQSLTPLHQAAERGHTDTVQCVIIKGADINIKDINGDTPLHLAALNGRTDTVQCLTEKGADINIKPNNGLTPLLQAAFGGHVDTVTYLVEKGANIHSKDNLGVQSRNVWERC